MDESSDLHLRGIRGGVWATVDAISSTALGFLYFVVLTRILGPESFGLMAMVEASLALAQTLLATSLAESLIQFPRLRSDHKDTLFWTLEALSGGLVFAAILLRGMVERFFVQEGLGQILAVTSFILYLRATGAVPRALLVRDLDFAATTQASVVSRVVGGIVGLFLALEGKGVWSLVFMQLASAAVELLMLWWKAGWNPHAFWSRQCFRELWRFSASRGLANTLSYIDKHFPRIILGRMMGAVELGQFALARRFIDSTADTILRSIKDVAMPMFAQVQDKVAEARQLYCGGSRLTACVVFPIFAGIALIAPMVIPLVLGKGWIGVTPLIQLFALTAYRRSFNIWNSALLRGLGRPDLLLIGASWRTLGTIVLIVLLLPYGTIGVCVAVILGSFINWPLGMRYAARLIGMSFGAQIREESPALGATLAMVVALLLIQQPIRAFFSPWSAAAIFSTVGVGVYLTVLTLTARADLIALYQLLKKVRFIFSRSGTPGAQNEDEDSTAAALE